MTRRTINGHQIAFHLDSRLDKLKEKFDRLQQIQDDLLDLYNREFMPEWKPECDRKIE